MIVGELIEKLSELPRDMQILFADNSYELNHTFYDEDGENEFLADWVLGKSCCVYEGNLDKIHGDEIVLPVGDVNNDNFEKYAVISIEDFYLTDEKEANDASTPQKY